MEYTVDAKNQSVGRLASKIAVMLRGKDKVSFTPNVCADVKIAVTNIDDIVFTGRKGKDKVYRHYSGYHGGLKEIKASKVEPKEQLRRAVWGMLPKNKSRSKLIKNLIFE